MLLSLQDAYGHLRIKTAVIESGHVVTKKCGKDISNSIRYVSRNYCIIGKRYIHAVRTRVGTVLRYTGFNTRARSTRVCIARFPYLRYAGVVLRTKVGGVCCLRSCRGSSCTVRLLSTVSVPCRRIPLSPSCFCRLLGQGSRRSSSSTTYYNRRS